MKKAKKKKLVKLLLLILNILFMVVSAFRLFDLNRLMTLVGLAMNAIVFSVTFGFYCWLRYKVDSQIIGRMNVIIMLTGLVMALFGASNVLLSPAPETLTTKYTCYTLFVLGAILYGWNDYKSEKLIDDNMDPFEHIP